MFLNPPKSRDELANQGIQCVIPPDIDPAGVLIDNTTLENAGYCLNGLAQGRQLAEESDAQDRQYAEVNNLLEALILYNNVYVEAFALSRLGHAQRIASQFADVVKAAYIPTRQRYTLAEQIIRDANQLLSGLDEFQLDTLHDSFVHFRHAYCAVDLGVFKPHHKQQNVNSLTVLESDPDGSASAEQAFSEAVEYLLGGSTCNTRRTLYYLGLAEVLQIGYLPHPWRALLINCLQGGKSTEMCDSTPLASRLVRDVDMRVTTMVNNNQILKFQLRGVFSVPPVLEVVRRTMAKRTCSVEQAIRRVRDSSIAVAYRSWVSKLVTHSEEDPSKFVADYQAVLEAVDKWKRDAGELVRYEKRPVAVAAAHNFLTAKPTFEIKDPVLTSVTFKRKSLVFLHALAFRRPF
jgi:hypothetical protein